MSSDTEEHSEEQQIEYTKFVDSNDFWRSNEFWESEKVNKIIRSIKIFSFAISIISSIVILYFIKKQN